MMIKIFTLLITSMIILSSCSNIGNRQLLPEKRLAMKAFSQVPTDFKPRKLTVVSAGDSLTQGVGDSTGKGGYLPYLKKMLEKDKGITEVNFYNYGVKGNRTTQLLKRLQTNEIKNTVQKADIVILTIGGNDIMKVVTDHLSNLQVSDFTKERENYIHHLNDILATINRENPHTSIVLVGLYNPFMKWFSNIGEMNKIVDDWNKASQSVIANYNNAYFVAIEDLFDHSKENLLFTDNFHPNDKGYELIALRLQDSLGERAIPDLEKRSFTASNEEN
jgi:lysophospholipase L1-like esterase